MKVPQQLQFTLYKIGASIYVKLANALQQRMPYNKSRPSKDHPKICLKDLA